MDLLAKPPAPKTMRPRALCTNPELDDPNARASASAFAFSGSRAAGEAPGDRVESGRIAKTDPEGALAWQTL